MARKGGKKISSETLRAQDYLIAAQDHVSALAGLYAGGNFALALYVAGVAVECLFRAYRAAQGLPFRSDHPLADLARESGVPDLLPPANRAHFDAALANVVFRWRNSHRFRSNMAARRFLKGLMLDRGIKGDFLKENARLMISSAVELVSLGVLKWH